MDKDNGGSLEALLDDAAPASEPQASEPVAKEPASTGVTTAPPAEQVSSEQPKEGQLIPRAALEDERKKRQERDREVAEYKRQLDEAMRLIEQAKQPKQVEQPPDWLLEPDKAAQHQQTVFQQELFQTRVHLSQEMMRAAKPDYDEMEELFASEAAKDPSLQAQLLRHPAPAKFAYETGQRIKAFREIGDDPTSYRAKIEQEILAKYGLTPNGQAAPAAAPPKAAVNAPKSLASVPSAAPRDQQGRFAKAASLEDILGE